MNTVIDFIEPYLNRCQNEKRLSKDTVKAYRLDLCQYRDYLYEMKMKSLKPRQVTKRMIQEYIMYLNEKFAANVNTDALEHSARSFRADLPLV